MKVFTMSHGQAYNERGLIVNKEIVVENVRSNWLCAQHIIYDATNLSGKVFMKLIYQTN